MWSFIAGLGVAGAWLASDSWGSTPSCSIYWTGHTSTAWGTARNWSLTDGGGSAGRLPGRSDYVCMSASPSQSTAILTTAATVAGINWPKSTVTPTLQIGTSTNSNGTLTVGTSTEADASQIANIQVWGTVIADATVTAPTLKLTANGTLSGSGSFVIPGSGNLSILGGELQGGVTLQNHGSGSIAQDSTLIFADTSVLDNAGQLTLADTSSFNGTGWMENESGATLSFAGSASSSSARVQTAFDNYGTVSVTKGTLTFTGGTTDDSAGDTGSYDASSAAVIAFKGYVRTFRTGTTFPGAGEISLTGGRMAVPSGTTLTLSNLLLSGSEIAGHGSLIIAADGVADLADGTFSGGLQYINNGTTTQAATADLEMQDTSIITNNATMTLADSAVIENACCTADGWIINSSGASLSYTGSALSSSTLVSVPFDNFGSVAVQKGTLKLNGGSSTESAHGDTGSFATAAAGSLTFGGDQHLASSASFTGVGQVTVTGRVHVGKGTTIGFPDLQVSNGTLAGKGTINIPEGDDGTLGGAQLTGGLRLLNNGSMAIQTATGVDFQDGSVLENAGTVALSDSDQIGNGCCGSFVNDAGATMRYTGSASNSTTDIAAPFDNFGSVTIGRGTLTTSGGSSPSSAGDSGSYNVADTAFLNFNDYPVRLIAKSGSFPGNGQVSINGSLDFEGSVTLPDLNLSGQIEAEPNAVVTATVVGTPNGHLQLDGDSPGDFGRLVTTNALNLKSMSLTLANPGFTPPCGDPIVAAKASTLTGPFTGVSDGNLPTGGSLQTSYSSTTAQVLIKCPPPPAPLSYTYGTGGGFDVRNPSGYYAEPVNTATGAYSTQQTDAALPGLGVPFDFTRYYSSDNTAKGDLGTGWTNTYSSKLAITASTVTLTSENAQTAIFKLVSGQWVGNAGVASQLAKLPSGDWQVTRQDGTQLTFNASGQLTAEQDRNGVGISLSYTAGLLTSVTDNAGRTVTFTYTGTLLSGMSLPLGRSVSYGYNGSGQLISVSDPSGAVTHFIYSSAGLLASVVDGNGHTVVANTYNTSKQVVSQTNALGQSSTFSYAASPKVTTFTDARGNKWVDAYNGNVLTGRTDPAGDTTSYVYDNDGDVSASTSPNGNVTTMEYDDAGNMIDRTAPAPLSYNDVWTYNNFNEPLTFTDGRGNTTTYSYDSRGNLLKVTAPDGSFVSHTYDATTGARLSTTDASGKKTSYFYDSAGNLIKMTDPLGKSMTMAFDAAGRMTSRVSPRGNVSGGTPAKFTTTFTYDNDDRSLTTTDPLGHVTTTTYDAVGNVLSVTNPRGNKTSYTYDDANHQTKITAPNGSATSSTYDAVGNLATRINGNGRTTTYAYDSANRLTSTKTPLGETSSQTYDPDGSVASRTDATGAVTTYSYDQLDRRTAVTYSDSTPAVHYAYDADSNVTKMVDGIGTNTYTYDTRNHLTKTATGSSNFIYGYTPDGQVNSRTYPDGLAITATYDADQRLASVTSGGATTSYSYDADGNLSSTALPSSSGASEKRTYDNADRLTAISAVKGASTLDAFTIKRDPAGNPTNLTTPSGPITYTYDSLGRLTKACYGASCATNTIAYAYDNDGNIKSKTTGTGSTTTTTNTFNADDELTKSVTGANTTLSTYDAAGRQTSAGPDTYSWNAASQLTAATVDGTNYGYTYDGYGNRATSTTGSTTTTQTWDINGPLPQLATSATPTATQNYLWGNGSLGFTTASGSYYDLHDDQGSTVGIVDSSGTMQSTASYDGYGNTLSVTSLVAGAPTQQIGWQGQVQDPSQQYDLRAREYDPTSGRFLSQDPLPQSVDSLADSPYAYANDQPTVGTDPSGLCWGGFLGSNCNSTAYHVAHLAVITSFEIAGTYAAAGACVGSLGAGCAFAVAGWAYGTYGYVNAAYDDLYGIFGGRGGSSYSNYASRRYYGYYYGIQK